MLISVFLLIGFIFAPVKIDSSSVEYVLDNYRLNYEESIKNIEDFIVETDTYTIYYKKVYQDGRPYFKSKMDSEEYDISSATSISDNELFTPEMYDILKEVAVYEGVTYLNGYKTYLISTGKVEGLFPEEDDLDGEIHSANFYIDTDKWVVRKIEFEIEDEVDGDLRRFNPVILMDDYRDIEGMMVPFKTTMIIDGLSSQMTEQELEEAREGFRELEENLEQMSPEEREMMMRMIGPQIEEYKKILETDRLETSVIIKEVRVNTGLTDEFFLE